MADGDRATIRIDPRVVVGTRWITGANEPGKHVFDLVCGRDFTPDGTIEAVSMPSAPGFVLGVQWHPEYKPQENPYSVRIFQAFGDAVHARARRRLPIAARAA